jgi:hypothetical protein
MQARQADPRLGVWKLNLEKSKYGSRPQPKSVTVTWAAQEDDMIKYTAKGIDPMGQPTQVEFSAKFDGTDYAVTGSPLLDTVAVRRIVALTHEATGKKEGKVILTTKGLISDDGKTDTTVWTGTDEKGQPQSWTTVMDKQ